MKGNVKRSKKEQQRINELHEEGKPVFLNGRGHLCFRQKYPNFPLIISIIALAISIIAPLCR
ncbi:MAG: hypothetical protein E7255_08445 [Lachnospiraceae bacterium]|nr:hypothetical protein [Lachnospiraceae bacterium]